MYGGWQERDKVDARQKYHRGVIFFVFTKSVTDAQL